MVARASRSKKAGWSVRALVCQGPGLSRYRESRGRSLQWRSAMPVKTPRRQRRLNHERPVMRHALNVDAEKSVPCAVPGRRVRLETSSFFRELGHVLH